jgi:hypothetical protein
MVQTIFDILEKKDKQSKVESNERTSEASNRKEVYNKNRLVQTSRRIKEAEKGNEWMPWLPQAKKDAISCDKLRGGANNP